MKVEMEVFRAQARGVITLEAPTVQAAKERAVAMMNGHEVPMEPVEGGVVVRLIRVIKGEKRLAGFAEELPKHLQGQR